MPRSIAGWSMVVVLGATASAQEPESPRFLPPLPDTEVEAAEDADPGPGVSAASAIEEGFEGVRPCWRQEAMDAAYRLHAHDRSDEQAYDGDRSEHFSFVAGPGSHVYYSYPLPRVELSPELKASLYVKSNRPGLQLIAHVVLPADLDPDTNLPFSVSVPGTAYDETDRWRRLEVVDLVRSVERQVWALRAKTKRPVRMEGAYLDRLVVNLYGGPGQTETFLDALRVAPVAPEIAEQGRRQSKTEANPIQAGDPDSVTEGSGNDRVQLLRNRLNLYDAPTRRHYPWFPTLILAPGADVPSLRKHGFDVFASPIDDDPAIGQQAVDAGFLLMPLLGRAPGDSPADPASEAMGIELGRSPDDVLRAVAAYPHARSVAFWNLGDGLGRAPDANDREAELDRARLIVEGLRERAPDGVSRLATATLAGDLPSYARRPGQLDLLGASVETWGTTNEPLDLIAYLKQRQDLAVLSNPEATYWTWIPTVAPALATEAIWGQDAPPPWGRPQVQPEQIRVLTYAALTAGCRAIGFHGDAELTRETGRSRLIELAFLNYEVDLFEAVFAQGIGTIRVHKVFPPIDSDRLSQPNTKGKLEQEKEPKDIWSTKAAAFETPDRRGTLLLVSDFADGTQIQPGQLAEKEIKLLVPGHQTATAWEVSLGGLRYLDRRRVPGGIEISLPDFGPTAMVLVTADLSIKDRLEAEVNQHRAEVIELAIQQAEDQLRWVIETHAQLARDGHVPKDSNNLLRIAEDLLTNARAARARGDLAAAWAEARRVGRPLRILMAEHQKDAFKALQEATTFRHDPDVKLALDPVSSPPLVSFNTLPQQWIWTDAILSLPLGDNELPQGEFEETDPEIFRDQGWTSVGYEVEGLSTTIENLPEDVNDVRGSRRMLHLGIRPTDADGADQIAPFQDHPVVAVQSPPVYLKKHQFVRISVLVRSNRWQSDGVGGLIVRDSIGGSLLQFREHRAMPEWRRVVLYRRAPADGELTVTIGLAASYGDAYFDDLRIERAVRPGSNLAGTPGGTPIASSEPADVPRR